MRRSEYIDLATRLLAHVDNGTTDSAEDVKHVQVKNYVDPVRWQREMDLIFKRLPLLLAFTCEMPNPGDFKSVDVVGVPVLIVRGQDGLVRAFIGVCSHRGTLLTEEGKGRCEQFTCPYHGWTYDDCGALIGVAGRRKFGDIDTASRALTELPSVERAGLIFVALTPGGSIELEDYLGGMLPELESFGLANIMTYDSFGPHQRVGFPTHKIAELRDKPQQEWEIEEGITERTVQNHIFQKPPSTNEERSMIDAAVSLFVNAVQNEDNGFNAAFRAAVTRTSSSARMS